MSDEFNPQDTEKDFTACKRVLKTIEKDYRRYIGGYIDSIEFIVNVVAHLSIVEDIYKENPADQPRQNV